MTSAIDNLLARARKRIIFSNVANALALAGALAGCALVLLLLLGTQVLNWWVPLLLLAMGAAAGLFRLFWRRPATAGIAFLLDQRCSLADALSTELFFRGSSLPLRDAQRLHAEAVATGVDLEAALPYRRPRAAYALAASGVAAVSLFFFRYGTERQLQLSAPISFIQSTPFDLTAHAGEKLKASEKAGAKKVITPELMSRLGSSSVDNPSSPDEQNRGESAVTTGAKDGKDEDKPSAADAKDGKDTKGEQEASDSSQPGAGAPKQDADQPPSGRDAAPQSAQSGGKTPGSSDGSGLLSKLKDAVSNLMSKMKPQQSGQSPQTGQQGSQQANGKQPSGQQGSQKKGDQDGKGTPSQQEGDESASAESEQSAPSQGAGKSSEQNASSKPGSGMGKQDGNKDVHDAEQLAAMGKLSEIIGKRSAAVTGEMTIESKSSSQQLKTGYTHSNARHGESNGDVSRDEVPVALQSYVQQYFEQVRKQAGVKTARAGKAETHE